MRALLPTLLLLVAASLTGQTRSDSLRRLQFGLTGGVLLHDIEFTPDLPTQERLTGNFYGLALRYFDNPLVGFQAEASYVGAGWREEVATLEERYERRADYAELLLLTQLSPGRGVVQPLLQGGPFISFPVGLEETIPEGFEPDPETTYYGRDFGFRINYGLQLGAGLNVEIGRLTLQLDGRYLLGFNDVIPTRTAGVAVSRRRALGGHAGLFLDFGSRGPAEQLPRRADL